MPSEITQVLPLALSQLLNQNHNLGLDQRQLVQQQAMQPKDITYLTQVAAAQTVTKVKESDKGRGTQVPKRPEANFANNEEHYPEEAQSELEKTEEKKSRRDLNVIA